MISEDRVADLAIRAGIRIDAFGAPVVDKFDMLVDLARKVEEETEARFAKNKQETPSSLSTVNQDVPVKRGPGRPKKVK